MSNWLISEVSPTLCNVDPGKSNCVCGDAFTTCLSCSLPTTPYGYLVSTGTASVTGLYAPTGITTTCNSVQAYGSAPTGVCSSQGSTMSFTGCSNNTCTMSTSDSTGGLYSAIGCSVSTTVAVDPSKCSFGCTSPTMVSGTPSGSCTVNLGTLTLSGCNKECYAYPPGSTIPGVSYVRLVGTGPTAYVAMPGLASVITNIITPFLIFYSPWNVAGAMWFVDSWVSEAFSATRVPQYVSSLLDGWEVIYTSLTSNPVAVLRYSPSGLAVYGLTNCGSGTTLYQSCQVTCLSYPTAGMTSSASLSCSTHLSLLASTLAAPPCEFMTWSNANPPIMLGIANSGANVVNYYPPPRSLSASGSGVGIQGGGWIVGSYGPCSCTGPCKTGFMTQTVTCAYSTCDDAQKPTPLTKQCTCSHCAKCSVVGNLQALIGSYFAHCATYMMLLVSVLSIGVLYPFKFPRAGAGGAPLVELRSAKNRGFFARMGYNAMYYFCGFLSKWMPFGSRLLYVANWMQICVVMAQAFAGGTSAIPYSSDCTFSSLQRCAGLLFATHLTMLFLGTHAKKSLTHSPWVYMPRPARTGLGGRIMYWISMLGP